MCIKNLNKKLECAKFVIKNPIFRCCQSTLGELFFELLKTRSTGGVLHASKNLVKIGYINKKA